MPISRTYGGYSSYSSSYYSPYSLYSTHNSSSYVAGRSSTPAPEDSGHYGSGFNPLASPATYKYLSRSEYYSAIPSSYKGVNKNNNNQTLKTINTEDIDVETDKKLERDHAIPGEITRDTAAKIAGGKQVVRIVTSKQRSNPYNLVGIRNASDLTLGQKLALKHLLVDPKEEAENKISSPPPVRKSSLLTSSLTSWSKSSVIDEESVGESSDDWTWETCSSSEEGPDVKYFPATPPAMASPSPTTAKPPLPFGTTSKSCST